MIAAGMLRVDAGDAAVVRAGPAGRPERCWAGAAARRRAGGWPARHAGRIGADGDAAGLAARRRQRQLAGAGRAGGGLGQRVGADLARGVTLDAARRVTVAATSPDGSSSRHTGDSVVNGDHTSTSSSSSPPPADAVGSDARDLAGRRLGPVRQRAGVVGAEAQPAIAGVVAHVGPRPRPVGSSGNSGPPNSSDGVVAALTPPPHLVAHRVSLVRSTTTTTHVAHGGQTSSSSASLRPSALSICSTCSWVIFSSSFSARSSSSAEISPSFSDGLEVLARVAAEVAHGDAAVLGHVLDDLDVLLAALLGERREVEPDDRAVVARVDAEVAVADRLLDGAERGAVVRLDEQLAGLGHLEAGELLQRDRRAVVLDVQLLDERRRGPAGAHGRELRLHVLDRLVHLVDGLEQRLVDHRASVLMREHADWPPSARPPASSASVRRRRR